MLSAYLLSKLVSPQGWEVTLTLTGALSIWELANCFLFCSLPTLLPSSNKNKQIKKAEPNVVVASTTQGQFNDD